MRRAERSMSALPTSAIVLAGGLGTRLKDTVPDLPKPMAPVNNRPFLEHLLDYWIGQGIERFVLSVGYKHEIIQKHFGAYYKDARVDYAIETTALGTGGGALLAAPKIADEYFLLLNGDTYFAVPLAELASFASAKNADWVFSLFRTTDNQRYMGMEVSAQGCITQLQVHTALANGGVYIVRRAALVSLPFSDQASSSLEKDIFPAALASGQGLFGIEFGGSFIDIGVPDDYRRAGTIIGNEGAS